MDMRIFLAVCFLSSLAAAQNAPDARALLQQTGDALRHYQSFEIHQNVVVETQGVSASRIEMPVTVAVVKPGKLRIESNSETGSTLVLSDGENTYTYLGPLKQFARRNAASSPEAVMQSLNPGIGRAIEQLKNKEPYLTVKLVGEESVVVGGKRMDCYVVEATLDNIALPAKMRLSDGVQRVWIDKASKITLKLKITATMQGGPLPDDIPMTQTVNVTLLKLNQPLPDSLFRFTPPEGVKEVPEFEGLVKATADLKGRPAPDFTLKSMDGKDYSLKDFRGQVVILDFWASWCTPCRADLPMLDKIYQEYQDQGLVMLGLNVGEGASTVGKFLAGAKVSFPVLITAGTETEQTYSVTAHPTVVLIDREGKVAFYHVGAGAEKELRSALAQVGFTTSPAGQPPK